MNCKFGQQHCIPIFRPNSRMPFLMNCHYCHNLCRNNVSSWICDICPAEFFDKHTNLYTTIDGKKYTFQMNLEKNTSRLICPGASVIPTAPGSRIDTMVRFDSHIINLPTIPDNITPDNVNEKVRLYLLFYDYLPFLS